MNISTGSYINSVHSPQKCASPRHARPNLTTQPHADTHHQPGHLRTAPVSRAARERPRQKLRLFTGSAPNPGTPTTEHAAATPRPPRDDHPTLEHATIGRARGGTIAAPATQRAHIAHIPSNASPNSVTTRPSLHESHQYHHTRALPSPKDPKASKPNPTGPTGALTAYAPFIFLCTGRVPE